METNNFANGVKSMARNVLPACQLLRSGKWTVDDLERWLNAVINDDPAYIAEAARQIRISVRSGNDRH
jgi:hypothetical protein